MKILDETNAEVWNDYLDTQGHTSLIAPGVVNSIFGDAAKTFRFYVLPEVQIDLGAKGIVRAEVLQRSGGSNFKPPFLVLTQKGGSDLLSKPLKIEIGSLGSKMSAADIRSAAGALNMLWVYKRAMQFLAATPNLTPDMAARFNNFKFYWDPLLNFTSGTAFTAADDAMKVQGDRTKGADDSADAVLLHEMGHKVHNVFGPYRSFPSLVSAGHCSVSAVDPEMAWKEGWANFFQAAVKMSPTSGYPTGDVTAALYPTRPKGETPDPSTKWTQVVRESSQKFWFGPMKYGLASHSINLTTNWEAFPGSFRVFH